MSFSNSNITKASKSNGEAKLLFGGCYLGHENADDVVAEAPTMRSVSMMSTVERKSFGDLVQLPPLSKSFSKPGPFGLARPQLAGAAKRSSNPDGGDIKRVKNDSSKSFGWVVSEEDLEMVPWEYPLERTHREIKEKADCVASRISEVLRSLSVEAEFNCGKAKCKTADCVHFRIRLYAGADGGKSVVVELQRRNGSSSSFMKTCRAVLDAAEGKICQAAATSAPKVLPPFMNKPISSMKCLEAIATKEDTCFSDAIAALDGALEMLRSEKRDANILGLENIMALTSPLKSHPKVALHVSKTIILGNETHDIREEIRLLTERDHFILDSKDDELPLWNDQFRHLAFCIFANALTMCSKDGILSAAVKEQRWFGEYLIPSLLDEIKRADSSMHNACQAAVCLHSVMNCSSEVSKMVLENGADDALEMARQVGDNRHEMLSIEASRCLQIVHNVL